jgi:hypothetical protein
MSVNINLPQNNKLFKSALHYAQKLQWAVLPIHAVKDGRCTCGKVDCQSPGKHPLTKTGVKDATRDLTIITNWWRRWPWANVGIATGAASGFFVLDVDGPPGAESLRDLEAQHGKLPSTVEQITGGGGRHLLFRYPENLAIGNKVGMAPGLDVRGDGGYIVAPPSVHVSGRVYTWELSSRPGEAELAEAPSWLLGVLKPAGDAGQVAKTSDEWQRLATTPALEGERNGRLTSIAGHLLRRYVNPYLAQELLLAWNERRCSPPLSEAEVLQIVESVAGAELRRRGCAQ